MLIYFIDIFISYYGASFSFRTILILCLLCVVLFLGFYLMRIVQITNIMNSDLLKKKRPFHKTRNHNHLEVVGQNPKHLEVVGPSILMFSLLT